MHLPPMLLSFMKTEWLMRFLLTPLPMNALQCTWWMLYNAYDETIQNNLVNTTTDFFSLPEHNLLDTLETIVAKKSNQAVYQLTFSSLFQSEGESVTDFVVWLKSISPDCEFSCRLPQRFKTHSYQRPNNLGTLQWKTTNWYFSQGQPSYTTRRYH